MKRFLFMVSALALLFSATAFSQQPPSNTSRVTDSIFQEAEDYYLDPTFFWLLQQTAIFLEFDMPSESSLNGLQLGGATPKGAIYLAGLLNLDIAGKTGALTGNEAYYIDIDQDVLVDGNELITGKVETRTERTEYDLDNFASVTVLVGLQPLGIGNELGYYDYSVHGSFLPFYSFAGSAVWTSPSVDTTTSVATSTTVSDTAGTIVSQNAEGIGNGYHNTLGFFDTATVGFHLQRDDSPLRASASLGGNLVNTGSFGAYQEILTGPGSDSAVDYTPGNTLDGSDPVLIPDVIYYLYEEGMEGGSFINFTGSIGAWIDSPLSPGVTATTGIEYSAQLPMYSNSYMDAAGAMQRIAGTADTFYSVMFEPAVDGMFTGNTLTMTTVFETTEIASFSNTLMPETGVVVEAGDQLRFGIVYSPEITLDLNRQTVNGTAVRTVVYDDGDSVDSADDSVTEETITLANYSTDTTQLRIAHALSMVVQFFLIPQRLRINLGAQYAGTIVDRTVEKVATAGFTKYQKRIANGTTAPADDSEYYVDTYDILDNVRNNTDASKTVDLFGSSQLEYAAGLTFFFSESMILDLIMDASGSILDSASWALGVTILR